jgi:multiple sugar transport system permease protein
MTDQAQELKVMDAAAASTRRARLSPAEHRSLARRRRLKRELTGWAFLAPILIFFMLFSVIPVILVFWWSTQKGNLTTPTHYVGFSNYQKISERIDSQAAISNTIHFAALSVPIALVFALAVAMLLGRAGRGGPVYRFLIYFPSLVPGVVAGLIWIFLTNTDFGLFNMLLKQLGQEPQIWLGPDKALNVLVAIDVWRSVGYWSIFFLAALIGLPKELFQAAELDGANGWQRFRHLTLPMMRRIILFAVIVATIGGLQVFDTSLVVTNGGPGTSTLTIVYLVWGYVFGSNSRVGLGAAVSVLLLLVILTLTLVQLWLLRSRRGGA